MAMTLDGTSGITQMTGSIVMSGSTSGTTTIIPSSVAGTTTVTMPAATGTMMVSGNMPAFSAYANATQTITTGVFTKVQINTKVFDTATAFDATTNYRFTPLVAGYYQINGAVQYASIGTNQLAMIYKNGTEFYRGFQGAAISMSVSGLIYMNGSTDYVELYTYATGGGTLNSGSVNTFFNGCLVRSA